MDNAREGILIELTVSNHPGVMSHICGLFSRRAYNLEKILCFPRPGGQESKMWLLVGEEDRLDQVLKQIDKLEDVQTIDYRRNSSGFFLQLEKMIEWL
ncbi:MAG TPA: ACT domain-containing protein [Desulfopila sp.]|nr:ACT domain-containing protein [Desulfopila sp.]